MQDAQQQQDAIRRIATALRNAATRPEKCTLLIGAGCSVTAGIKSAAGIVTDIRDSRGKAEDLSYYYDNALARAQRRNLKAIRPDYSDCMAELPPGPQRALLRGYIDRAKLNWAHVGIGALVANGYVDRILTTNFDPLIARGCAVFHEYPAVYDLTMSPKIKTADLPDKAVFHLHGQRNGFSLLNSDVELQDHKQHLKPLFDHARGNRTWIVCGYSGDNDPLMDFIVDQARYDYELFWIDIKDTAPERLRALTDNCERSFCRYFKFPGADQFFIRLAKELGLFPFTFMNRPLDHLRGMIEGFTEFPLDATDTGLDLLKDARKLLDDYQSAYDSSERSEKTADQSVAEEIAGQGESAFDDAALNDQYESSMSPSMRAITAFIAGNRAVEQARAAESPELALRYFQTAAQHFSDAAHYDPTDHEALNNWGVALFDQTRHSPEAQIQQLLVKAVEKFAAALAIKPDEHKSLNNWGIALIHQVGRVENNELRDQLLNDAEEKLQNAEAIAPGTAAYDLACVHALRRDAAQAVVWLNRSLAAGKLPTREHIEADDDFAAIREHPEFVAWLKKQGWAS